MSLNATYTTTTPAFRLTTAPDSGTALPLTDPSQYGNRPQAAFLQATVHDIRFTTDGSAPTSSHGAVLVAGSDPFLYAGPLVDLRFIQSASGAVLNVVYASITDTVGPQGPPGPQGAQGSTGPAGATGRVQSIVAGSGITVDATDPTRPIVAASGGLLSHSVSLAKADVLALDTVPFDILPAVSGYVPIPLFIFVTSGKGIVFADGGECLVEWDDTGNNPALDGKRSPVGNTLPSSLYSPAAGHQEILPVSSIVPDVFHTGGEMTQSILFNALINTKSDWYSKTGKSLLLKSYAAFTEVTDGIATFTITNPGSGYGISDDVGLASADGGAYLDIESVDGSGAILSATLFQSPGGYTVSQVLNVVDPAVGTGAQITVNTLGSSSIPIQVRTVYYLFQTPA